MKTAVVIGSTGLIGSELVKKLVSDGSYAEVIAVVRRVPEHESIYKHPRVRSLFFDFKNWGELDIQLRSFMGSGTASFFCCLGTTRAKAGSEEEFRRIDHAAVVEFARLARACRAEQLLIVSALGADKNSAVFYNRVKGEMEEAVQAEFSGALYFFRPSLLLGDRTEFRFGERLAILLAPLYSPLLIGNAKKYRPVQAAKVARAMLAVSVKKHTPGMFIENSEIGRF